MLGFVFGPYIVVFDDVLTIEDRRPTLKMVLASGALVAIVVIAGWGWLTGSLIVDGLTIIFGAAALGVALFFVVKGNFREVYIFDKKMDTYTFTRQSVLRKDVLEGSASQFRAVQIEKRIRDDRDLDEMAFDQVLHTDSRSGGETYMVALLNGGMLFGQSDTQILREDPPFLNSRATESRIAAAIAKFLNIPREGVVDVL